MKSINIKGTIREKVGKQSTKKLRKIDHIPCVLYGGDKVIHFSAQDVEFKDLVYTPHVFEVNIDLDGKVYKAIMKDLQFHPVNDDVLHIDFIEVFDDKPVTVKIPIQLTGSSIGVKNGGKMRQRRRVLKVNGLVKDLPETLAVDVTDLDISQVIKVGDLQYDKLDILDPHRSMIVGVVSSRLAAKGMAPLEEEAEEVEGGEAVVETKEGTEKPEESGEATE